MIVQGEGLVIAILSWVVAIPLSMPMSAVLGQAFSRIMIKVPITLMPSGAAILSWLAVVVGVSVVACAWPAIKAMRVPVAAALAYE
jgi:putative ABC transport system permease protein